MLVDPGLPRDLPVRPQEGRAAARARRGRRGRLPRRRAGAEADRAAGALLAGQAHPGDGEARAGHEGDAPRHHRAPATRSSTSSNDPRRADVPGPRGHRRALGVRAAHHHAGHDRRARGRDGRDRQRPQRARRGRRRTRASCSREVMDELIPKAAEVGETLKEAGADDAKVGICPKSGHDLLVKSLAQDPRPVRRLLGLAGVRRHLPAAAGQDRGGRRAVPGVRHAAGQGHPVPQQAARRAASTRRARPTTSPRSSSARARRAPRRAAQRRPHGRGARRARSSASCAAPTTRVPDVSYPLPQRGEIQPTGESCARVRRRPMIVVQTRHADRGRSASTPTARPRPRRPRRPAHVPLRRSRDRRRRVRGQARVRESGGSGRGRSPEAKSSSGEGEVA